MTRRKNFCIALFTLWSLFGQVVSVVTECAKDEKEYVCSGETICYGGENSNITADDLICMLTHQQSACNHIYRKDACGKCDERPDQHPYGSQYKDCTGKCYEEAELHTMKEVDKCGVCDGTITTCNPKVSSLDMVLISDAANFTFNITGTGLETTDIQILLLTQQERRRRKRQVTFQEMSMENVNDEEFTDIGGGMETDNSMVSKYGHNRFKRASKTVEKVLSVIKVYDWTTLEIRVDNIPAGEYEVGARDGDSGLEYQDHTGPTLTVYSESAYTVASMSPTEQDLDGSSTVSVTLTLNTQSEVLSIEKMYDLTGQFQCFFSDNMDAVLSTDATSSVIGAFSSSETTLECEMDIPQASKETWVCPSFNNKQLVGCQKITFFEAAPVPVNDRLTFTETGDGGYVSFDKPVYSTIFKTCLTYFADVSQFGTGAKCHFNEEGNKLNVQFGDENTVRPGDNLELKAGLVARDGLFKRRSEAVNLTMHVITGVLNDVQTESIKIAPRSSWPTKLTSSAKSPIILGIQLLNLPGNRAPESITWTVNEIDQVLAKDKLELALDITAPGQYDIKVSATDFLGGESVLSHSLVKENIELPTVIFSPEDVKVTPAGTFIIYPNTVFAINTKIYYKEISSQGLEDYKFQWKRNGKDVPGRYYYKSTKTETTIDMCGDTVEYSMVVSTVEDTSTTLEYSITMVVVCRDPVAMLPGNDLITVDKKHKDITIFGTLSYDPDGGQLSYSWTCSTQGNPNCIDSITSKRANSTTSHFLVISPSRMGAGKKYAIYLTVSVEKSGELYNNTDKVIYAIKDGIKPVIRWVTMRSKFRSDVPIMIKAHVGTDVMVEWRFIPNIQFYDWVDAGNVSTGKASAVTEGFAWYTIRAGVLKPGSQYKMELKVSKGEHVTTEEYDIYIYKLLRGCEVEARPLVEFEESSISLLNCAQDPDVAWRLTTCTAGDRQLHLTPGLTFIVPMFKPETNSVVLMCKIIDSLGNEMAVNSSVVSVTKATESNKARDKIAYLKQSGDLLGALGVLSEMADSESDLAVNSEAVTVIHQIANDNPSPGDIRGSLRSFNRLKIGKIDLKEKDMLAKDLVRMLEQLCSANQMEGETALNIAEIKEMIENSKLLVENTRNLGPLYRTIENKIACIKVSWMVAVLVCCVEGECHPMPVHLVEEKSFLSWRPQKLIRLMQNEDHESLELDDGSIQHFLVNTLEDVKEFGIDLEFPEELKSIYRDQWTCGRTEDRCHGVGVGFRQYLSEPPNLLFGRTDHNCDRYVSIDLYNPVSGNRISVRDLTGTINFNLGHECPRAQCWYYDEFLKRYAQDGVYTVTKDDGSVMCQTTHLTAFTVRSEPEMYEGKNIPYIVAVCVGVAGLLVSAVVLVKLFLFTKHQANAVESGEDDEKQLDLDDLNNSGGEHPVEDKKVRR